MENLLYYPYINIPKTDWTVRSLLYYDQIASIVPLDYFHQPELYDPFMLELVQRELVLPVSPMDQFKNPWKVCEPFLKYMESKDFDIKRRRKSFKSGNFGRINQNKFGVNGNRIHTNKFDHEILYQLEQSGLALRDDDYQWYIVEKRTAGELMMFLASILSKKMDYLPATDLYVKSRTFVPSKKKHFEEEQKREIILKNFIPFPQEIDLNKLSKFKDKNLDLLKTFKNKVELIALDKKISVGSKLFDEKIKELEIGKDEVAAKMKENKFGSLFFGTFCGISGAAIGLATAGTTGAVIGGLPSFANAVYSALQVEEIDNSQGMKYIALVDRKLRASR